jgi:hypothetical protein
MLDRKVVRELLEEKFKEMDIVLPKSISQKTLTETFCKFTEDDYYEWFKDNFKTFFNYGNPDWDWIKERIKHYSRA